MLFFFLSKFTFAVADQGQPDDGSYGELKTHGIRPVREDSQTILIALLAKHIRMCACRMQMQLITFFMINNNPIEQAPSRCALRKKFLDGLKPLLGQVTG